MRKVILGAAAAAMLAGSTVAHAAAPVADARTGSPTAEAENFGGASLWLFLLGLGLLAFILVQVNEDTDTDGLPTSP